MKKVFTTLAILVLGFAIQAQTNMGINNANPDASAALDVTSTTQGMLVPRMTLAQRNMINMVSGVSTPATGLLIYQTDNTPGFYFYNGTAWTGLSGGTSTDIYSADGSLAANRSVNLNSKSLDFSGTGTVGLNGNPLRLQAASNGNNFLRYDAITDGPILSGLGGGKLNFGTGGANTAMSWSSSGTSINSGTSAFTLPTGRGTNGQVLITNGSGAANWTTPTFTAAYPSIELDVANNSIQNIPSLAGTANTNVLTFSGSNNGTLTGNNTWDGSIFTVGSNGAGWYQFVVEIKGVTNTGGETNIGVANFLALNNSTTPLRIGTYDLQSSAGAIGLRNSSKISTILFLPANSNIRFRGQSWSTATAANTSTDGGTNITIVRLK